MNKPKIETGILAEIIVLSALSAVLYAIRPFSLQYGGSVTLGSMVPVMWLALRRGVKTGLFAGAIFGILALFIDVMLVGAANIAVTPIQVILEYPVAFGVLGLAGLFHKESSVILANVGAAVGVLVKFLIHYLVGAFIWVSVYDFPPEWGQWLWPAVYNGSFLLVEFVISAIVITILVKRGTLEYSLHTGR
ncbi:MAG: energy-coupled thiamine transporter ThiT [Candidatus Bathyarchaeota archaeon]|nr:MAG: energy-coupled thiamine transporter ThiT [Candidatus Bathyarchaeota archaeon]